MKKVSLLILLSIASAPGCLAYQTASVSVSSDTQVLAYGINALSDKLDLILKNQEKLDAVLENQNKLDAVLDKQEKVLRNQEKLDLLVERSRQ